MKKIFVFGVLASAVAFSSVASATVAPLILPALSLLQPVRLVLLLVVG